MMNVNKETKLVTIIFLFILFATAQKTNAQNSFYVYFEQNDKRINIKNERVELKNQPFNIFLEYNNPVDILVSASNKMTTFNDAVKGKLMFFIPAFSETKNPESFFVNKGTINLFSEKITKWEKEKTDAGAVKKTEKNNYAVYKYIDKIYSTDDKILQSITDVKKNIQMVFIYAEKDPDGELQEIQREIVKIKWTKSYEEETKTYERQKKQKGKLKINEAERKLKRKKKLNKQEEKRLKKIDEKKAKDKEKSEKKEAKNKKKEKSEKDK